MIKGGGKRWESWGQGCHGAISALLKYIFACLDERILYLMSPQKYIPLGSPVIERTKLFPIHQTPLLSCRDVNTHRLYSW